MTQADTPDAQAVNSVLRDGRNWQRWGDADAAGAVNLIDADSVLSAARSVATGTCISLSRTVRPTDPEVEYELAFEQIGTDGYAHETIRVSSHGQRYTHVDALCHAWDASGTWGGHAPSEIFTDDGSTWSGVDVWRDGIVTRGILLDVPRHRGVDYVTNGEPVTGAELAAIAEQDGVSPMRGDAVIVYSGRDRWEAEHEPWGTGQNEAGETVRPGLEWTCLNYVRSIECSVVAWDMMDEKPGVPGMFWGMHSALFSYGIPLVDNCDLARLAAACRERGNYEFMFVCAPLVIAGATGSPVNPIAVL